MIILNLYKLLLTNLSDKIIFIKFLIKNIRNQTNYEFKYYSFFDAVKNFDRYQNQNEAHQYAKYVSCTEIKVILNDYSAIF
jgi:hypothetical protein